MIGEQGTWFHRRSFKIDKIGGGKNEWDYDTREKDGSPDPVEPWFFSDIMLSAKKEQQDQEEVSGDRKPGFHGEEGAEAVAILPRAKRLIRYEEKREEEEQEQGEPPDKPFEQANDQSQS